MSHKLHFEYNLLESPLPSETQPANISLFNGDYLALQKGIDVFNSEIEWDDMWNIEDAKTRLNSGWKLITLILDNKICGWNWLDVNTKTTHNLFVSKLHTNKGYGLQLKKYMLILAKQLGIDKLKCEVDDWNKSSIRVQQKAGWVKI